jgi:hypothetical protein
MLHNDKNAQEAAKNIVSELSDRKNLRNHSRHISAEKCKSVGLKVENLEDDNELQDLVLTIHHCFMHTFSQSSAIKIIENHLGVATVQHVHHIPKTA